MSERIMPSSYVETVVAEVLSEGTILYSKDKETRAIIHHRDPHNISHWERNPSISISELEEIIAELTTAGADRVQIFYHEDHEEYHFVGTKLEQELPYGEELELKIGILVEDYHLTQHYLTSAKSSVTEWEKRVAKSEQTIAAVRTELENWNLQQDRI